MEPKDPGPDIGCPYQTPKETAKLQENVGTVQPSRSLLTSELLAPGEELIGELDYEDVEETDPGPDPEIAQAVAHIPKADAWADVEMQESNSPLGFEPEVSRSRYDVNLVCTDPTELGSASLVTAGEDKMLDEEVHSMKTPAAQKTFNFPGHYFPGKPMCIHEDGSLLTALDWRLKFRRCGMKNNYSILIRFAFGADTFRTSWTRPLSLVIQI